MARFAFAAIALIAASGCTPAVPDAPAAEDVASQAATERLMGMETCAGAQESSGPMVPELTPCRIDLGEGQPRLVVTSTPMAEGPEGLTGTIRIEVVDQDGVSQQVNEEMVLGGYTYPYAEDLTGDGALELMVPLMTGNVNTSYALWLRGEGAQISRAGVLGGVSIGRTPDGLISASGRSSATSWETGYFRVTNGALEEIAAVVNRPDPEAGEPPRTEPACEVIRILDGVDPAPFCAPGAPSPY